MTPRFGSSSPRPTSCRCSRPWRSGRASGSASATRSTVGGASSEAPGRPAADEDRRRASELPEPGRGVRREDAASIPRTSSSRSTRSRATAIEVVRPRGCRYLNYEGEVALIVGRRAKRVPEDDGSRLRRRVLGRERLRRARLPTRRPGLDAAREGAGRLLPDRPRARRRGRCRPDRPHPPNVVNGEVVQEGNTGELLFSFAYMLADLSRLITLEEGDILLTGTPANSRPVEPGDVVEVEVEGIGRLSNRIVEAQGRPGGGRGPAGGLAECPPRRPRRSGGDRVNAPKFGAKPARIVTHRCALPTYARSGWRVGHSPPGWGCEYRHGNRRRR